MSGAGTTSERPVRQGGQMLYGHDLNLLPVACPAGLLWHAYSNMHMLWYSAVLTVLYTYKQRWIINLILADEPRPYAAIAEVNS